MTRATHEPTHRHESHARKGPTKRIEDLRETVSDQMHRWPVTTVAAAGGLGLAAAALIGVGELAIAGAAGYAAYKWLVGDERHAA